MKNKIKAIIPCCGYGKRMGMRPNESKEMLLDSFFNYIIDHSFKLCEEFDLESLVITRKDKKDLIKYLKRLKIKYMLYEPKANDEWNHSVMASKKKWTENNILILPDTRFSSITVIEDIKKGLELNNNAVIALHEVNDPKKWGIIKDYKILEKPKGLKGPQMAWGLIGFKKHYGEKLFTNINGQKLKNISFTYLENFVDITRNRK